MIDPFKNKMDDHFLSIRIPSDLREDMELVDAMGLEYFNAQWEFHTTPVYRMKYEDLDTKMEGITFLSDILLYNCPEYAKNEFKNALNLYARGYWVASISLCGIIVEYLTKFYFPFDPALKSRVEKLRNNDRIKFLREKKIISVVMKKNLSKINSIRNSCVHLDTIDYDDLSKKNIEIINSLIQVLFEVGALEFEKK